MAQASDTFDYSAINLHMAKQLVKDLLEAFDAEGNRSRLARALVTAQERTDALMLNVTPLAIDIASEALSKWGIVECEGDAFVRVMERVSLLAPRDEELSFDVYQLKNKFLPVPPKELLEAEAKRVKEELRQQRRAAQQAKEEAEARDEARKKAEMRQFARETFGEGTTA
jgi:flagellar biosynthesis/type III secretory pathway protein FliH